MPNPLIVRVADGKYTFTLDPNDGRVRCLRYGESWVTFDKGTKAILALMHELDELRPSKPVEKVYPITSLDECEACGNTECMCVEFYSE